MTGRVPLRPLLLTYAILLVVMILAVVADAFYGLPITQATRDPAATFGASPYTGFVSNLGILAWGAAVTVCLFTAILHRQRGDADFATFMLYSALLTALLLFDDLFLFHEHLFPLVLHVREKVVYLIYMLLTLMYIWIFRAQIRRAEYPVFMLACVFFALSVGIDVVTSRLPETLKITNGIDYLLEDGAKFFGIATWCLFFARTALLRLAAREAT